jgi:hypothetical protein
MSTPKGSQTCGSVDERREPSTIVDEASTAVDERRSTLAHSRR